MSIERPDEALLAQAGEHAVGVTVDRSRNSGPIDGGRPSGSRLTAPKSSTPRRPSSSRRKLPGCGSACSMPTRGGARRTGTARAAGPARSRSAGVPDAMIRDERLAVDPLADQHLAGARHDVRHEDVRVAVVRRGERGLAAGLEAVVELLGDPCLQLGDQRLDVQAGHQHADESAHPAELVEVGEQRLAGARILHLDGHLPGRPPRPRGAPGRSTRLLPACPRRTGTDRASRLRARWPARHARCAPAAAARTPAAGSGSRGRDRRGAPAAPPRRPTSPGRTSSPRP